VLNSLCILHYLQQNVGFNEKGVVKLFDLGFAVGLPEQGLLYDRCGTPRYMAPEIGLSLGYGLEVDVYSFGILLWEMCALELPYNLIKRAHEFEHKVFVRGHRPEIDSSWPENIKEIIIECWSPFPHTRPKMMEVKAALHLGKNMPGPCRKARRHQDVNRQSCYL
jgi:serine/threonine protein kinase